MARDIKWQADLGSGCAPGEHWYWWVGRNGREMTSPAEKIVEGISLDRRGTVTVAPGHQQTLCDVSLALQDVCKYAVDVEHVVAALVMAVRDGRLERDSVVSPDDQVVISVLMGYMPLLFEQLKGVVDPRQ